MSAADQSVPDDYLHMSGVAAALQAQYVNLNFLVVGLQEGRCPKLSKAASHYFMFSSGAEFSSGANYGCELWFSRHIPHLVHRNMSVCFPNVDNCFFVIVARPRLLVIDVDAPYFRWRCMFGAVSHASTVV